MAVSDLLASRLLVVQSYKEPAWGTTGAATCKWMGVKPYPTIKRFRSSTIFDEVRGNLAPGFLSAILKYGGDVSMGGYLTYEDAIFLGHGIFGIVVPGGGGPYTYTYAGPSTSQPTLQSYTLEYNQANGLVQAQGFIMNKVTLKGEAEKEITWDASGFCKDVDTTWAGPLAGLSDRVAEIAVALTTTPYLDASGGVMGGTAFAGTLLSWTWSFENKANAIYTAGSLTPTHWVIGNKVYSELTLQLLWTPAVRTFVTTVLEAGTGALVRLDTASAAKHITLDFAGVLNSDISYFPEKNGAQYVEVKLGGKYDVGWGSYTNFKVINNIAAVP